MPARRHATFALPCAILALAGCGGGPDRQASTPPPPPSPLEVAAHARAADFPAPRGRTLEQLASTLTPGPQVALAGATFVRGRNRLAFGVLDRLNAFLYGETAVYVAPRPGDPAEGPYPASGDSLEVSGTYRSRTTAQDSGAPKAVYTAQVPLRRVGHYAVLTVTRAGGRLLGGTGELAVRAHSAIPAVGDRPPAVATPTLASVRGRVQEIDTRDPPDDLHAVSFRDALGKRPVALLIATPALCQSRVCGPVVDEAEQLKATYGDRVAFIHQEVYTHNRVQDGLRPQMRAFHLGTEPWLFAVDRRGRIAARLEGAFGVSEFRSAVEAALR